MGKLGENCSISELFAETLLATEKLSNVLVLLI